MSACFKNQKGIAPLFIVLLICFFFLGFILWNRNIPGLKILDDIKPTPSQSTKPVSTQTNSPSASPQKMSLKEACLSEAKSVPKPPFRYQLEDGPVGTLQPNYKKERFSGAKNIYSCYTSYMYNRVMVEAYADMGVTYYTVTKTGSKYVLPETIKTFEKRVDEALSNSFKKAGWERQTQYGETNGRVPVMLLTKTKDGKQYFMDISYPGATGVAFSYVLTVMEK